jgi:cytochrome b6-f complex iron-sulfur subunit
MSDARHDVRSRPGAGAGPPSRLDPETAPRRDFLGIASLASAAATLLFAFAGMARLPRAAVLASPSRRFKAALPENQPPGEAFVPEGRSVALFRDAGGAYAISTVCTHLGCIVKPSPSGFDCPCHGSKFGPDGTVLRGPAPKALAWKKVAVASDGSLMVDEETDVPPGTKVTA